MIGWGGEPGDNYCVPGVAPGETAPPCGHAMLTQY